MKLKILYILLMSVCFAHVSSYAQTRKELENRRKKIKNEIKQFNSLIVNAKKEKTNALDDLKDINQKINIRERLISTIEEEAKHLEEEINTNEKEIGKNEKELKRLKKEYSDMVQKTYKSKSQQSKTMFLLSSKNFYQAYKRVKYMQQYNEFRKKQGENILLKISTIEKLNDSLILRKKEKEQLVVEEKEQKDRFESDKKDQESLVGKIKKQERKYKRELQRKIKEEKRIAARIDKLIREAIARANASKKKKATTKTVAKKNELVLDKAEKALLANFEQNKGKLPWPVTGIITRKFGVQPHPTFSGISINSPGLHITTKANTDAKSIFNGTVMTLQANAGGKKSVYIQHGSYITVYNNLESTYVKKGDKVKTGQKIGKVFTDKVSGKTKLIFILYKNIKRLNPSYWIARK